jgi:UDP-N-acetylmuramoyl-L-alanyl-D-glutamate--2,6-diaminopimelate ligase
MSTTRRTLAELLDGVADAGSAGVLPVSGLSLDSRALADGEAFIALRGTRGHGIEHAAGAVARGAAAVLFEPPAVPADLPVPVIAVPDLRAKLGAIADRWFDAPSAQMTVVGVTGTNGKTSTVQLLAQALTVLGASAGTIGTLGAGLHGRATAGERTTPDVISVHRLLAALRAQGASHVAMEVSSHALDQGRVDAVAFDIAVFTNLTRDHLDYHGTMMRYFEAKAQLFDKRPLLAAVINIDDPAGAQLVTRAAGAGQVLTCSANGNSGAALRASGLTSSATGIGFELATPWGELRVQSPLLGRFNVDNLLAVAACLGALGQPLARIAEALAALTPVAGRMNRLGGDGHLPLVVVDYAHTPDALEQTLGSLRAHTAERLLCVFGCGGERDAGKRPQMGAIAERLADALIVTDDNPRGEDGDAIVAGILSGLAQPERAQVLRDRASAIARAVELAGPRDTVLVAGKGHEDYQEVAGHKRPFDDLRCARSALQARA